MKNRIICTSMLGLLVVAASACGGPASTGSGNDPLTQAASPLASPVEAARVQSYLDSLYRQADVRHSFTSRVGDAIDCVDFDAEPQVVSMRARGVSEDVIHYVPPVPESMKAFEGNPRTNDAFFLGDPDSAGRARACPEGTVAHVRVTADRIAAAGGLDAYRAARHRAKALPPKFVTEGASTCGAPATNLAQYEWAVGGWEAGNGSAASGGKTPIGPISAQGAMSTINIAAPAVPDDGSHSLQQVWLVSSQCISDQEVDQTIEVGNMVDPQWSGTAPILFLGATADYYETTGCIDGEQNADNPNVSWGCGWVPNTSAALTVGGAMTPSAFGGTQHEMKVSIEHNFVTTISCGRGGCTDKQTFTGYGVWVSVDGAAAVYLGSMENSWYNYGAIGSTGLVASANYFQTGAEIYSASGTLQQKEGITEWPYVEMGEGNAALECCLIKTAACSLYDYGNAAYSHDFAYFPTTSFTPTYTGNEEPYTTAGGTGAIPYWVSTTLPGTPSTWENFFYVGPSGAALKYCL